MHSKDLYSNAKVVKRHKNQRKTSIELIKKIIPRSTSGSYDLNPFLNESSYAPQHIRNQNKVDDFRVDNETLSSDLTSSSTSNNTEMTSSSHSESNVRIKSTKKASNTPQNSFPTAVSVELPKKRTCFGFPILCFAYFAAIYTLVSKLELPMLIERFLLFKKTLMHDICMTYEEPYWSI
jgi:hypothetical protein